MNNSNNQEGKFLNGFLLGILVGAALVFLFGTKKGKKLLKAISEEGMGNISNLLEKADKSISLDEISDEEPSGVDRVKEEIIGQVKPKIKRFFRGTPKHLN